MNPPTPKSPPAPSNKPPPPEKFYDVVLTLPLALTRSVIIYFGVDFIRSGAMILGLGLLFIGVLAMVAATVFVFRGRRLGAEVLREDLIIHRYFTDHAIPLSEILGARKTDDSILIISSEGPVIIENSLFPDATARDTLFQTLILHLRAAEPPPGNPSHPS